MIGRKTRNAMKKKFVRKLYKKFSRMRKNGFKKHLLAIFRANFFMFVLLISYIIWFFSFNLKLICTCEFFKNLKLHSPKRLVQFWLFENSLVQINSKLNSKPYDYLYLNNLFGDLLVAVFVAVCLSSLLSRTPSDNLMFFIWRRQLFISFYQNF